jgi:hypothetical protein
MKSIKRQDAHLLTVKAEYNSKFWLGWKGLKWSWWIELSIHVIDNKKQDINEDFCQEWQVQSFRAHSVFPTVCHEIFYVIL